MFHSNNKRICRISIRNRPNTINIWRKNTRRFTTTPGHKAYDVRKSSIGHTTTEIIFSVIGKNICKSCKIIFSTIPAAHQAHNSQKKQNKGRQMGKQQSSDARLRRSDVRRNDCRSTRFVVRYNENCTAVPTAAYDTTPAVTSTQHSSATVTS